MKTKYLPVILLFLILYNNAVSQSLLPDSSASSAMQYAVASYNAAFSEQLHLFNGKEYLEYVRPFSEGHPFFIETKWSKGTVNYDGNRYKDVSILYNIVTDEVIILDYNKVFKIQLLKEKVLDFSLLGHSFVKISSDSLLSVNMTAGFYDILAKGKVELLARRTKSIQTYVTQEIELKVHKKDHFYLKKNNGYYPVNSKKSFFVLLDDKKKEIQQYIKRNKLRYRKDMENTMVKTIEYYNQLTR